MSPREGRWPEVRRAFRLPLGVRGVPKDVDAELRFHLEGRIEELVASGMPREEAVAEARRRFGDLERIGAELQEIDRGAERHRTYRGRLGELARDIRYAVRGMIARPLLATVIVITLALGMGANTAIFSVVYSVLLRPLPYAHGGRLLDLRERNGPADTQGMYVTYGNFGTWTQRAHGFEAFGAVVFAGFTLTGLGEPAAIPAVRVSAGYWRALFIPPILGRYFTAGEDRPGAPHVVVLSEAFWRSTLGGDRGVIGRSITLSGVPYTVIGVAPAAYSFSAQGPAVWVPLALTAEQLAEHSDHELQVIGVLREGVPARQALADLTRIETELAAEHPNANFDGGIIARPLRESLLGPARSELVILFGAVMLVLLIACANVTSLLLARAAARRKEIAIRCALGAGRGRLVTLLVAESLTLSLVGAAVGLGVAWAAVRLLVTKSPLALPRLHEATLNAPVLAFAAGLAVLCGLALGLLPALRATRIDLQRALREGGRESSGVVRARLRTTLVVGEVALTLVLLVAAGLLVRSAILLQRVSPGFDPHNVLVMSTGLPDTRYPDNAAIVATYRRIVDAVRAIPGVRSGGLVNRIPIGAWGLDCGVRPDGSTAGDGRETDANLRSVSGSYFPTLGIPLLAGRALTEADDADAPPVVVINRHLAHRLFGQANPLGRRLATCLGGTPAAPVWREVVGVVGDIHANGLRNDVRDEVYFPYAQFVQSNMWIVVRGAVPVTALTASIRRAVLGVDPLLALSGVRTMDQVIDRSLAPSRFTMVLFLSLGLIALVLASVGIYGVIAYLVTQRSHEIGVRMALGADRGRVLAMVVRQGVWFAALGAAIGLAAALGVTRALASQLYGVGARDPLTFGSVTGFLLLVATVASWIPGRRAVRVDPTVVLRGE